MHRPITLARDEQPFVFGLEIPFPGNEDRFRQRLGSKVELLRGQPEHLVLAGPPDVELSAVETPL